ncbi:MAG: nitroreductase family deazaflavin-dependent oxidoreductase [Acidimicrobiales bacterium]|nr:nitroreductase family deazaflavin-dependent oxidoreductase [Acidimicrobiales bacterium]RZV46951.1 MAG: nitroreductase family deazaflavin-dependent oxidoreductase [Acidimicrobiales bacterium]
MHAVLQDLRTDLTRRGFDTLNRVMVPLVKAGVGTPPPIGLGLVVLETTGRVSGKPRQVPLVATRFGNQVNVSTVRGQSQWVKNLQAQPNGAIWVDGRKREATACVEPGPLNVASLSLDQDESAKRSEAKNP